MLLGRDPLTGKQTGEQSSKATDIFQCCTQAESCPNVNNQPYYVDDSDYGNTGSRSDALGSRVTVIGLDSVRTHLHTGLESQFLNNHQNSARFLELSKSKNQSDFEQHLL